MLRRESNLNKFDNFQLLINFSFPPPSAVQEADPACSTTDNSQHCERLLSDSNYQRIISRCTRIQQKETTISLEQYCTGLHLFSNGAKMVSVCEGRKKARLNEIKKIKIRDTLYLEVKWTKNNVLMVKLQQREGLGICPLYHAERLTNKLTGTRHESLVQGEENQKQ